MQLNRWCCIVPSAYLGSSDFAFVIAVGIARAAELVTTGCASFAADFESSEPSSSSCGYSSWTFYFGSSVVLVFETYGANCGEICLRKRCRFSFYYSFAVSLMLVLVDRALQPPS